MLGVGGSKNWSFFVDVIKGWPLSLCFFLSVSISMEFLFLRLLVSSFFMLDGSKWKVIPTKIYFLHHYKAINRTGIWKNIVNIDCLQLFSLNFVAKTYILHTSFVSSARFTLMICRLHTPYSALMKYQKPVAKGDVRGPKKDWYKLLELAESCSK